MFTEIFLFAILLFMLLLYTNKKPSYLPPGRWGWPIIGLVPKGRKFYYNLVKEYKEKYGQGGIYCSTVGSRWFVFITDIDLVRKAFSMPELSGRPQFYTLIQFGQRLGVTMSEGKRWQHNRRFTVKNLRDIGVGKSSTESMCQLEIDYLLNHMNTITGKPFQLNWCLHVALFNVIFRYAADTRFDLDDPKIHYFSQLNVENFEIFQSVTSFILDFYPWTNHLPYVILDKCLQGYKMEDNKEKIRRFMMQFIDQHRQTLDRQNPRDFIDVYLIEAEKSEDEDLDFFRDDLNLVNVLINFFNGSDLGSLTFRWIINLLAKHPEIQEKMQKQIDQVVPRDRLPTMEDRDNLPYVDACVYDAARKASIVTYLVPHVAIEDTKFEGYLLPKGTTIMACADHIHHDKRHWERPNEYYPEHFLDKDGKFVKNDYFMSFSMGKRLCIGKSMTDMNLFLFTASIFQRFTIRPADYETITYEGLEHSPFSNFPKDYDLVIEKRF